MHLYPKRASLEGLEVELFKLVSYSATPEQWKEWLRVPLEHAAARGNLDLFNKLLGGGADGSAGWKGCRGRTLLDAAAVGGNEDVASGLLRVGAQPDVNVVSSCSKRSALYTAATLGHEAVARRLIVAGADVNFFDPVNRSAVLAEATRGGHDQLVIELLITGADPNTRTGDADESPLHVAASKGFDGIVSTLLLRGGDKDALDGDGNTPLILASSQGRLSVVKTLLAAGADASDRERCGSRALGCAAKEGHVDVIKAFAGHGLDVNRCADLLGFTALHLAAQYGKADAVDALVEAGADVELATNDGVTPLEFAACYSNCEAILSLLQHGAKIGVPGEQDRLGALHAACIGRDAGVDAAVDLLLRWGADETALDEDGQIPAELVSLKMYEAIKIRATQDEVDRARLLLARAPADRAWRRRGWLVMLRSRAEKARSAGIIDSSSGSGDADGGRPEGQGCKAARRDEAGRGDGGDTSKDVGAGGGVGAVGGLSDVVKLLVGVEPEGVFRTIVGYL